MTRVPTEKQYALLRTLAGGAAGLSRTKRDTDPLLRRGWVTAEWAPPYYQWVRITPAGLRALADAVERYGLPDLDTARERATEPPLLRRLRLERDDARAAQHIAERRAGDLQRTVAAVRRVLNQASTP